MPSWDEVTTISLVRYSRINTTCRTPADWVVIYDDAYSHPKGQGQD